MKSLIVGKSRASKQQERAAWMMIAPFLIGFAVFGLLPVLSSFLLSFLDYNRMKPLGEIGFSGLANYIQLFGDSAVWKAFLRSGIYMIVYVPGTLALGLTLALLLNRSFFGRGMIRLMVLMPYVTNIVAVAMVFSVLLDPFDGPVNKMLAFLGVEKPPLWLGGTNEVLPTIALISVWQGAAFHTIVYLAALQSVPRDLYEAADMDGASKWRTLWSITLPAVSPTTFFLMIVSMIGALQNYGVIKVFSNGGPGDASRVISFNIYEEAFSYNHYSYASAQSVILFLIVLIITLVQWKGQKRWVHY
ncbi:MAG: sugar ABC transporter permease [Gorillibacterium sp.]|nr:sugar ABC transporter permease [Gorillibacterium sp.]